MASVNLPKREAMSSPNSSTLSEDDPKMSVEATITSERPGIGRQIYTWFAGVVVFARIRHQSNGTISVTLQGHPNLLELCLLLLKDILRELYHTSILWSDMTTVSEENELFSVSIENSPPAEEKDCDEISLAGSATTEHVQHVFRESFHNAADEGPVFWAATVQKKHVSIKRGDQCFDLEVSNYTWSWENLTNEVKKKFQLTQPIWLLYRISYGGDPVFAHEVKDLVR